MPLVPKRWALGLLSGLTCAFVVSACTGSSSERATTSSSATTVVLTTAAPSTTESAGTVTPPVSTTLPPADRVVTETTGFTSPTGNIGCYIGTENVRCDIGERDWQPPPKPADCDLDYGQGIAMHIGGSPRIVCAGDTARARGTDPLPYGQSIQAGSLRCDSAESGMSCNDLATGHGFTLSRQDYTFR
jgi:hypothetical protein